MHLSPSAHIDTFAREQLPPAEQWPQLTGELAGLTYPDRLNCGAELLDRTIEQHGTDRPAVIGANQRWTYGELRTRVDRIAHVLTGELAVRPGNRVLLRGPTTPDLAACWLAVMKAGAVAVTVLAAQRAHELRTICEIARISHALCDVSTLDDLAAADAPGLRVTPYGGASPDDLLQRAAAQPARFTALPTSADDVALIAFTSGTTGRPKGCMHFHRDVLAVADTFSTRILRPRSDDVFAGSPPLGFTFGLGGLVVFPLRVGASTVLQQWHGTEELLEAVPRHRVSVLFTAPTAYRNMLTKLWPDDPGDHDHQDQRDQQHGRQNQQNRLGATSSEEREPAYDISTLRRCVSAGENLPVGTWQEWHRRTGLKLIDGIGATEMLHIFISAADETIRPGTTGLPVPGFEARIVEEDGTTPVPDGTPGLLAVRGPVGCRYLADERQREYVRGGWNITGDTYVREPGGYLRYVARADDMIISAGYNIAGPEVEDALLRHPDVREAAVVGRPDERRGQSVVAHVVPRAGAGAGAGEELSEELRGFVQRELTPYKCPREIVFTDELPRTPTGKLQRFRLRDVGSVARARSTTEEP